MSDCRIPAVFEYDESPCPPMRQQSSPFDCCQVPCSEGNEGSCCPIEYATPTTESMWDCEPGWIPDWCDRLEEMQAVNPSVFSCITPEQLEWMWREVQCSVPKCACSKELMEYLLLCHLAFVEVKWNGAYETALVAGAIRGTPGIKPMFSLSSGLGGATNLKDSNYLLSQYGMRYLALRDDRRNTTGAYASVARGSHKLNLRAMTGVY